MGPHKYYFDLTRTDGRVEEWFCETYGYADAWSRLGAYLTERQDDVPIKAAAISAVVD